MVPRLTTALSGPLLELERKFIDATPEIERWLRGKWQEHTPPFYGSVDLRNAGFKLAPVDMNLFPGGFNNLNPAFLPLCVQAAMTAIDNICPVAKSLLLIPENHTRNLFYLQNVAQLVNFLRMTGLNVRIGSLLPEIDKPTPVALPNGTSLLLEPLVRTRYRLGLDNFDPCAILLNNDLSAGIPDILQNLNEQFVLPPLHAGWAVRRKSNHFAAYDDVAEEFAQLVGIDPWRINPYFGVCSDVNFHDRQNEDSLAAEIDAVFAKMREKYREYGIEETPYVVVKA
ncbi:MAG: glutamate--cysteine ligase, partial [Candidatus Accumulibacter sp.]|nr:glutamate--cysteine ligase [Accumulibacter sp.]